MLVASIVLAAVGLPVAVVGALGMTQRLPRNRFGGIRTPATLRTDDTFRVANRIAGPVVLVAGVVGVVSGLAAALLHGTSGRWVIVLLGAVGMVLIATAGGVLGHRAAEALPEPAPATRCDAVCDSACGAACLKG